MEELKLISAIDLATGRLLDPVLAPPVFASPGMEIEGAAWFPDPLSNWLAYRREGCLAVRMVDEARQETEIVLPQEIVLETQEDPVRAFFKRVNAFLDNPLPPATPEQLAGKTRYPSMERPTWIGSQAGLVRDFAAVLTFHEAKWAVEDGRSVAIFWAWGETSEKKARLALEPFDCVMTGLIGYPGESVLMFQQTLQASLQSLEGAIIQRNRPVGYGGMYRKGKIEGGSDRLRAFRRSAFWHYSRKYTIIVPMGQQSKHEEVESFAIYQDLIELGRKLDAEKNPADPGQGLSS